MDHDRMLRLLECTNKEMDVNEHARDFEIEDPPQQPVAERKLASKRCSTVLTVTIDSDEETSEVEPPKKKNTSDHIRNKESSFETFAEYLVKHNISDIRDLVPDKGDRGRRSSGSSSTTRMSLQDLASCQISGGTVRRIYEDLQSTNRFPSKDDISIRDNTIELNLDERISKKEFYKLKHKEEREGNRKKEREIEEAHKLRADIQKDKLHSVAVPDAARKIQPVSACSLQRKFQAPFTVPIDRLGSFGSAKLFTEYPATQPQQPVVRENVSKNETSISDVKKNQVWIHNRMTEDERKKILDEVADLARSSAARHAGAVLGEALTNNQQIQYQNVPLPPKQCMTKKSVRAAWYAARNLNANFERHAETSKDQLPHSFCHVDTSMNTGVGRKDASRSAAVASNAVRGEVYAENLQMQQQALARDLAYFKNNKISEDFSQRSQWERTTAVSSSDVLAGEVVPNSVKGAIRQVAPKKTEEQKRKLEEAMAYYNKKRNIAKQSEATNIEENPPTQQQSLVGGPDERREKVETSNMNKGVNTKDDELKAAIAHFAHMRKMRDKAWIDEEDHDVEMIGEEAVKPAEWKKLAKTEADTKKGGNDIIIPAKSETEAQKELRAAVAEFARSRKSIESKNITVFAEEQHQQNDVDHPAPTKKSKKEVDAIKTPNFEGAARATMGTISSEYPDEETATDADGGRNYDPSSILLKPIDEDIQVKLRAAVAEFARSRNIQKENAAVDGIQPSEATTRQSSKGETDVVGNHVSTKEYAASIPVFPKRKKKSKDAVKKDIVILERPDMVSTRNPSDFLPVRTATNTGQGGDDKTNTMSVNVKEMKQEAAHIDEDDDIQVIGEKIVKRVVWRMVEVEKTPETGLFGRFKLPEKTEGDKKALVQLRPGEQPPEIPRHKMRSRVSEIPLPSNPPQSAGSLTGATSSA